jgi:aspartate/methionine/tyrosine aminotransferase
VPAAGVAVCAPQEGVLLGLLAVLRPGDHVVVQCPGYQSLYQIPASLGCQLSFWEPGRCAKALAKALA